MKPYEKFEQIFKKMYKYCGIFVGHNILDPMFKINMMTIAIHSGIVIFVISCFYTMYMYDLELGLKCAGTVGIAVQVNYFNETWAS